MKSILKILSTSAILLPSIIVLLVFTCLLVARAVIPTGPIPLRLTWTLPPTNVAVDAICIYQSTTMAVPLTNWTKLATTKGTNTTWDFAAVAGQMFYYITASNFWGESDPSNVAGTPLAPVPGTLSIQRVP